MAVIFLLLSPCFPACCNIFTTMMAYFHYLSWLVGQDSSPQHSCCLWSSLHNLLAFIRIKEIKYIWTTGEKSWENLTEQNLISSYLLSALYKLVPPNHIPCSQSELLCCKKEDTEFHLAHYYLFFLLLQQNALQKQLRKEGFSFAHSLRVQDIIARK